ncbi:hypothetical protein A9K55_005455 [Cordyceps militaris]|uniref:Uncharacterized protein n=1 Tax=Cordyceps militaris TaxID=73501 RepID=A0A2H4SBR2_CORMI|nr:hypothetical protein A9K55_005455 [Cordyceps militaris]
MRFSQILCSLAFAGSSAAICLSPEPSQRICYNDNGATPQNLNMKEVDFIARYLRSYQAQALKAGRSPFWKMNEADADNCAEWQVTTKGKTWALAKLVGDDSAAVTFNDIANTIDPGAKAADADKEKALVKCGTAGGQMGVLVNITDPLYQSKEFLDGGYTNQGLVIKLVHSP